MKWLRLPDEGPRWGLLRDGLYAYPLVRLGTPRHRITLELNLHDWWLGVYVGPRWELGSRALDIWLCLIPCLPLHYDRGAT